MMTRAEHLAWCKRRALEYIDAGELQQGVTSMMCDLFKHDETKSVSAAKMKQSLEVQLSGDRDQARRFIEGFT
ncbi:hypothetical protein KIP88_03035 [Bradyrhizobium sp. SRL28]|uniref:hypothetical protein n=1 Tax=Bradyrhizobium sp. SRL28 TaxID=2836178 RepID=UPI001BDEF99E|nr:hypothetical protein [Bradyrhizobium sp. SRL28]MBT1509467.1 hypothetical protein [Bradyrhizobium sp. SRL28]